MKKVIIAEAMYQDYVSVIRVLLHNAKIQSVGHIANWQIPDKYLTSQPAKLYHGYIICDEKDIQAVTKCLEDAKEQYSINFTPIRKEFNLIKCGSTSDKWTETGYVKDLGKKAKTLK